MNCPVCGCENIGQGKLDGESRMLPLNNWFSGGSKIIADICLNCGYIISMRVERPDIFE